MNFVGNGLALAGLLGLAGMVGVGYLSRKQIKYIVSLEYTYNTIINSKNNKWYNEIPLPGNNSKRELGYLFLGALPIVHPINILTELSDLGVTVIVSVLEEFEMELGTSGLGQFGNKITPPTHEDIINLGFHQKIIETPDFIGVPATTIDEAVKFIHQCLLDKKTVYIHCKAGRGRSTTVVVCYLVKYHNLNLKEAINLVKSHREQINLNENQMKAIHEYLRLYCFGK